jgi:hypothetical protein
MAQFGELASQHVSDRRTEGERELPHLVEQTNR